MPAAVWSGTISFSLVGVPVQLDSTTESTGPVLHNHHEADADLADLPLADRKVITIDAYVARGTDRPDRLPPRLLRRVREARHPPVSPAAGRAAPGRPGGAAVVAFAMRERESLALLRPGGETPAPAEGRGSRRQGDRPDGGAEGERGRGEEDPRRGGAEASEEAGARKAA